MAIPNFSDLSFAQETGLEPDMLKGIIDACALASSKMTSVNITVGGAADSVIRAMESRAGIALRGRLQLWFDDFAQVTSKFDDLNTRATDMRNVLIASDTQATEDASAGQS